MQTAKKSPNRNLVRGPSLATESDAYRADLHGWCRDLEGRYPVRLVSDPRSDADALPAFRDIARKGRGFTRGRVVWYVEQILQTLADTCGEEVRLAEHARLDREHATLLRLQAGDTNEYAKLRAMRKSILKQPLDPQVAPEAALVPPIAYSREDVLHIVAWLEDRAESGGRAFTVGQREALIVALRVAQPQALRRFELVLGAAADPYTNGTLIATD